MIELRKRRIEADMEGGETPSLPYTLIPERRNDRIGASMMGSAHTYDLGKVSSMGQITTKTPTNPGVQ
jgi:splicing factor 3B subunit 2